MGNYWNEWKYRWSLSLLLLFRPICVPMDYCGFGLAWMRWSSERFLLDLGWSAGSLGIKLKANEGRGVEEWVISIRVGHVLLGKLFGRRQRWQGWWWRWCLFTQSDRQTRSGPLSYSSDPRRGCFNGLAHKQITGNGNNCLYAVSLASSRELAVRTNPVLSKSFERHTEILLCIRSSRHETTIKFLSLHDFRVLPSTREYYLHDWQ